MSPERQVRGPMRWELPADPRDLPAEPGFSLCVHKSAVDVYKRQVYSRRWTGPALEQLFGEVDHHLTVHGFCR